MVTHKGYPIKLVSYKLKSGAWSPWAKIFQPEGGRVTISEIGSRSNLLLDTKKEADAHALELAKMWIDGRLSLPRPRR